MFGIEDSISNNVFSIRSEVTVEYILTCTLTELSLLLRSELQKNTKESTSKLATFYNYQVQGGEKMRPVFDGEGLSFVVSDWRFPWKKAVFER